MSWLDELEYDYRYLCPNGHEFVVRQKEKPDRDVPLTCDECGEPAAYQGLVPMVLKSTTAIEGEQNGRKYVEYKDGNGRVRRISKTKLEYLRTGKSTESVLANDYKRHLERSQVSSAQKAALKE